MKILIAHNRYQIGGGEDAVFDAELKLLRSGGNEISTIVADNSEIQDWSDRLKTALRLCGSTGKRQELFRIIQKIQPDIVHVHNFFPLISPSIFEACNELGIPSVMTVHNFRLICAGAVLLRNGQVCEKCVRGSPYWGAYHRCYRGSLPGSLAVARMIARQRQTGNWRDCIARFIALTDFAKKKLVEAGLPGEKILVKPNFIVADKALYAEKGVRHGALFVGRLSPEKGLRILLQAWESIDYPLEIIGEGDVSAFTRPAPTNVRFVGRLPRDEVVQKMKTAAFVVMPSLWYEGFPMVLLEAMACGTPVIASRIGSLAEIVEDRVTGRLVPTGAAPELAAVVRELIVDAQQREAMGRAAHQRVLERYTPEKNLEHLLNIYRSIVGSS